MHKEGIAAVERVIKVKVTGEPCWKDMALYCKKPQICATMTQGRNKTELQLKRDYIRTVGLLTCNFESFIMVSSIFMHG